MTESSPWLLSAADPSQAIVGVVGAGTMGAGIAQVAASAGHPVRLLDTRPGAAQAAIDATAKALATLVDKGRISADERAATLARLQPVERVQELGGCALVVEAIVEQLEAKQGLLRELEACVAPNAILGSNTSSISVTALANGLTRPQRVVGMHFFNPVPLMKLVEVVSGAETDVGAAQLVFDTARRWGKTPVHAKSTPGFIVNRIARPYYAEALALLQEEAVEPAVLDALARSAGFRLGPCELMDLIGHDVNYAVTQSVFEANYGDRRYVPSQVQKALIDGGRLGRKVGKGFYVGKGPAGEAVAPAPGGPLDVSLILAGDDPVARALCQWLESRGLLFDRDVAAGWTGLRVAEIELHVSDGRTAAQLAAERGCAQLGVVDLPLVSDKLVALGVAFAASASTATHRRAQDALRACGWQAQVVRDVPGLWTARTVCMLVNEGADAVWQGVCSESGADLAMKLGVNWPAGPFEWLAGLGVARVVRTLDHLHASTRSERYRVSPLLQQRYWQLKLSADSTLPLPL